MYKEASLVVKKKVLIVELYFRKYKRYSRH